MGFISRKKIAAAAAIATVGIGGVVAYAFWTSTGNGSGSATTGTSTTWDVASTPVTAGDLTPGGPTDTVNYTVTNNNSGHQKLFQITVKVANSNGSAWTSGTCSASDFSVGGAAAGATYTDTTNLPADMANGDVYSGSVTLQMVNTTSNQDDCKSVTVPLYFSAS